LKIVFYDGDCGFCQYSILFLLRADKSKRLKFAPLNGETYKKIYGKVDSNPTSVVFYNDKKSFEKSSAFIEIARVLGGGYQLFVLLKFVPAFLRDIVYDVIARRRHKMSCPIHFENNTHNENFLK